MNLSTDFFGSGWRFHQWGFSSCPPPPTALPSDLYYRNGCYHTVCQSSSLLPDKLYGRKDYISSSSVYPPGTQKDSQSVLTAGSHSISPALSTLSLCNSLPLKHRSLIPHPRMLSSDCFCSPHLLSQHLRNSLKFSEGPVTFLTFAFI